MMSYSRDWWRMPTRAKDGSLQELIIAASMGRIIIFKKMQYLNETSLRKCASLSPTLYFLPSFPITLEVCIQTYWGTYAPTLEAAELWSKSLVDLKAVQAFVDVDNIWLIRAMEFGRKHQRNTRSWCSIMKAWSNERLWFENQSMICTVTVLLHVEVSSNSKILISCL